MSVTIRLSRIGKKGAPFYRIVAIDSRKKRDGACIENLGTYDPKKKDFIHFSREAAAAWISKGATVSDTVARLLAVYDARSKKAGKSSVAAKATTEAASVDAEAVEKKTSKRQTAKKE